MRTLESLLEEAQWHQEQKVKSVRIAFQKNEDSERAAKRVIEVLDRSPAPKKQNGR